VTDVDMGVGLEAVAGALQMSMLEVIHLMLLFKPVWNKQFLMMPSVNQLPWLQVLTQGQSDQALLGLH
jgi:hypothetical protein